MSRYLLLLLLNLPFVVIAIVSEVTQYKLRRSTRQKASVRIILWAIVVAGLALAQPLYEWLFSHNLTQTEPLSLFDVVQLTLIIFLLYTASRMHTKNEQLERRFNDLHQEVSIILSDEAETTTKQ